MLNSGRLLNPDSSSHNQSIYHNSSCLLFLRGKKAHPYQLLGAILQKGPLQLPPKHRSVSKWSLCLLLWLVAVRSCGNTVLMPQVLCQAVEEGGNIAQPITDLPTRTQHGQAGRLLESPHFPLSHITVHKKVKSKEDIKENVRLCWV